MRTSSHPLRCWAEIDLSALERNLRLIRASLPPRMRYVAVVKADAYGHGLHQTAARLMHAAPICSPSPTSPKPPPSANSARAGRSSC